RGGSKTYNFCRALLILGARRKLFILCTREIQKSITESVHRVLELQIDAMKLRNFYQVLSHKVVGKNGSEFVFAGIKNNITAIKSMEGIDVCAVFEATHVTNHSWDVLLPTVRGRPADDPRGRGGPFGRGPEIWVEFNPDLDSDQTYKRWVLTPPEPVVRFAVDPAHPSLAMEEIRRMTPQPQSVVAEINWRDNEWFPADLKSKMLDLRKRDYEEYLTVYEGKVRRVVKGAIFAKELEKAMAEKRIGPHVLLDRSKPVDVAVDLGRADMTVLWFVQQAGMEHRFIDCYGNFGFDWSHYLEQIQSRKYLIGRIYLPHDAKAKGIAAKKSVYQQTQDLYPNPGQVIV
ncbi:MAG: phage terminase large subunit, partial [Bradyrhizobium sp.]|nr:phage terminase large subunit [Bradyrhizobium sp.]